MSMLQTKSMRKYYRVHEAIFADRVSRRKTVRTRSDYWRTVCLQMMVSCYIVFSAAAFTTHAILPCSWNATIPIGRVRLDANRTALYAETVGVYYRPITVLPVTLGFIVRAYMFAMLRFGLPNALPRLGALHFAVESPFLMILVAFLASVRDASTYFAVGLSQAFIGIWLTCAPCMEATVRQCLYGCALLVATFVVCNLDTHPYMLTTMVAALVVGGRCTESRTSVGYMLSSSCLMVVEMSLTIGVALTVRTVPHLCIE